MRKWVALVLSFLVAASPFEGAWAQSRVARVAPVAPKVSTSLSALPAALAAPVLVPFQTFFGKPAFSAAALGTAPLPRSAIAALSASRIEPERPWPRSGGWKPPDHDEDSSAGGSVSFDGASLESGAVPDGISAAVVKELLKLRRGVQVDARKVLKQQMGGDVGDGRLHRDLNRVAARLTRAAGLPKMAAQIFIGNSFLPNAFTMITEAEADFSEQKSSMAKPFRVANVFLSLGLLRAMEGEEQLAWVIAHELSHNWKGHLKGFTGSHETLGHLHEFEADAEALKLVAAAGYDPRKAQDTLYALDRAYESLEKSYAMLSRRDKGEVAQSLARVRDVHPHSDLRRANMLDHLDEAIELYVPAAYPDKPLWKSLRESSRRPSALDRFEARARKAVSGGSVEQRLHDLEIFIEREKAKRFSDFSADEAAIVEEAYREILEIKPDFESARGIELSLARGKVVKGARLRGNLIGRQLELALSSPDSTLEDFLRSSAGLGVYARQVGALRLMGQVSSRAQLDAMYRALTRSAENLIQLGYAAAEIPNRLWRSTGRVLSLELGRAALPEEIIDELKANISPSWLSVYRNGLQEAIVESSMGKPERRSKRFTPSQLSLRLRGLDMMPRAPGGGDGGLLFEGLKDWGHRHYTRGNIDVQGERATHSYERYRLDGMRAPSERDFLDLISRFDVNFAPPPALIRLLRREGLFDKYLLLAMGALEEEFLAELKNTGPHSAVNRHMLHLGSLMNAFLYGVSDLAETARVSRLVWERVRIAHTVLAVGGRVETGSFRLADELLRKITVSVRAAVARLNRSGARPAPKDLAALTDVVRGLEQTLGVEAGEKVLLHHAAKLGAELMNSGGKNDEAYSKTIMAAIPFIPFSVTQPINEGNVRSLRSSDFLSLLLLMADERVPATTRLAVAALADKLWMVFARDSDNANVVGADMATSKIEAHVVGRWLVEDAVRSARMEASLPGLAAALLRLNDVQPSFLNPDGDKISRSLKDAFRAGAELVRRNEPYRALARGEHPFRGVNVAWAHDLIDGLDAAKAWPRTLAQRLDLLDFMNSNGEFSEKIDARIVAEASADPAGFREWVEMDEKRIARWGPSSEESMNTPWGPVIVPSAAPFRIVRNPTMRAKLFDLLPESNLREHAPRRGLRETHDSYRELYRAYRAARNVFSAQFLAGLREEGSLEGKFYLVRGEIERISRRESQEWRKRWDRGEFSETERQSSSGDRPFPDYWREALPHEKDATLTVRRGMYHYSAWRLIYDLYLAYTATQEPILGLLLKNYPEPTRSRDDLLERVIKARRLTPGSLSFLEANKSHRVPNPVRVIEKQILDQAVTHLRRFKPVDRVDLIRHLSGAAQLTARRVRELDRMFLKGDRKKLARSQAAIRGVTQLKGYLSLLHPKDHSMLVRALFLGPDSLHLAPRQVARLYLSFATRNRKLPRFLKKVFHAYFRVLTNDEKAILISNLAGMSDGERDLAGPEAVRIALKGMGVVGAKVAQVLATHRGLLPEEYVAALESFKDRAQDMGKMRAFDLMKKRLEKLADDPGAPRRVDLDNITRLAEDALPKEGPASRRRLARQTRYILSEEGRAVRRINYLGPELGSGSIKVVYKAELTDGRVWVVKLRAPGASHRTGREFEIVSALVAELEESGTLNLPGARQLVEEVRGLVRAEMNFRDEAAKEREVGGRARARPWYARLLSGSAPYVPTPHPLYESEDILVEEFVPTTRFADLPERSWIGPSRSSIARRTIDDGAYALLHDEWLEPDAHTGNRHARKGFLDLFITRLAVIDLGQGRKSSIASFKPLMRAGLALEDGDIGGAAAALMSILEFGNDEDKVRAAVAAGLARRPSAGSVERLMDGLLEAEKSRALVKPEYAALQKAFLYYVGYSRYLPKNGLYSALERATAARLLKDGKISVLGLAKLALKRFFLGRAAIRAEMTAFIEEL